MRNWLVVPLFLLAGSALAQMTPAELAEKGKKLSKEEVESVMSGAGFSYKTPGGFDVTLTHDKGGTVGGNIMTRGESFMLTGSWNVEGTGKYCNKWSGPRGGSTSCYDVYRLGDKIYFVTQDGKAFPPDLTR
jgi:hypothetical protein